MLELLSPPADLSSSTFWPRAVSLAAGFARAASSYYLECRPAEEPNRRLDLLVGVGRAERSAFASWCESAGQSRLLQLTQAWLGQGPLSSLSALWLEYDRLGESGSVPVPSPSVCLQPSYVGGLGARSEGRTQVPLALMVDVVETLTGQALSARERQSLERCRASLPGDGHLIHLSVMLGRACTPLKLYSMVPREGMSDFLHAAGWRGPLVAIERLLKHYCPVARVGSELYVDLTVSHLDTEGGNLVGLSFAPQHLVRAFERDPGRGPLLDECVRAGLCSSSSAQRLRRWPKRWLVEPEQGRDSPARVVEQWLDLKLVWAPHAPLELKAYLGVRARDATFADRLALASAVESGEIGLGASDEQLRAL